MFVGVRVGSTVGPAVMGAIVVGALDGLTITTVTATLPGVISSKI